MGAILYLVMDIIIHWGVLRKLRKEIQARSGIVITAIILDFVVLAAFLWIKANSDVLLVVIVSMVLMVTIFAAEYWFLKTRKLKSTLD